MILKHQYDSSGNHRIVELDIAGFLKVGGEWTGYNNIAMYNKNGVRYMAVTDYFNGTIEVNTIFQLHKTDFESETRRD